MRNITVDFGNTSIKAAIFEGEKLINDLGVLSQVALIEVLNKFPNYKIGISSVSEASTHIYNLIDNKERLMVLNHLTKVPLKNNYKSAETLGMDRLAVAVGGNFMYPNTNLLIIDFGTCITYELVSSKNEYEGGAIAPGLNMRFKALNQFTSKLPSLQITNETINFIGNSTESCIQSGVINGMTSEIDGMIDKFGQVYDHLKIIICGGDAQFFETKIKQPIFAVPNLVLIGLNRILNYNVQAN
ncbi:MAG: type III pantothenate kinase [Bacteroidota bacterium]|nr:type III pantothenate kinase [Bacteroidota bacterium]